MMNARNLLVAGLIVIAGSAIVAVALARRQTSPPAPAKPTLQAVLEATADDRSAAAPTDAPPPVEPAPLLQDAALAGTPPIEPAGAAAPTPQTAPKPAPPRRPAPKPREADAPTGEPVIPLPVAREALRLVGADATAEAVWTEAINDPNLSAEARSDLIEDLNEEGFPDRKNITQADLPLIRSRLAIIERLAPTAVDEVNAAAFQEAYKDLMNMLTRLIGVG